MIPRNTVMVEINSNTINEESFQNLSSLVGEVQEESPLYSAMNLRERGYGKLGMGSFMSSVDWEARRDMNHDELAPNLTFLYDGSNVDVDGKTLIPSAVLVHEDLSELQIKELREKLPAGVPILDGRTNELLDEVGAYEREMGRHTTRYNRMMGDLAFRSSFTNYNSRRDLSDILNDHVRGFEDMIVHDTDEYRDTPYKDTFQYAQFNPDYFPDPAANTKTEEAPRTEPVPESDEVRAYRERRERETAERNRQKEIKHAEEDAYKEYDQRNIKKATDEILMVAKDMYDASDLSGLDKSQLRKVERKVQGNLHPDRGHEAGGDQAAFKEVGVLMNEVRRNLPPEPEAKSDK